MRASFITLGVLVTILLVGGFFAYNALHPRESSKNSQAVRDFAGATGDMLGTYTDLSGAPINLEQFSGTVRVVNIWATWSPASATELKLITEVLKSHPTPVTFLAVNRAEPAPKVQAFVSRYQLGETAVFVLDQSDTFYKTIGGFAMPETIVYDTDGKKLLHHRGEINRELLESALENSGSDN